MSNFPEAVQVLFAHEGRYVKDHHDFGGETNFGISKRQYPDLNIKNLTREKARLIYYTDFWVRYRLDEVKNRTLSTQLLLSFANMSPHAAGTCIQKAANALGAELFEDGVVGSKTLEKINSMPHAHLSDRLRIELSRFYISRVIINKTQIKFLVGWLKRALR